MTEIEQNPESSKLPPARQAIRHRSLLAGAVLAILAAGAAAGAGGMKIAQNWQPRSVMLLQPVAIDRLQPGGLAAIRGNVSEIFGNKFVVEDGSGRALVDLGPRGENAGAVVKGETVAVQGMFDRSVVHAQVVSHADGRTESFGPPPRPGAPPPPRRAEGPPPPDGPLPAPRADAPPPPPPVDAPPLSPKNP
jgi:hypothetical protein